jgi:glycosyltransferase involved in cell wall biosynthesis
MPSSFSARTVLVADRLGGQCSYSGIHQLASRLQAERSVNVLATPDSPWRRLIGKAWSLLHRWPVRDQSLACAELAASGALATGRYSAVHFLVGENHEPYLTLPRSVHPVIATLHMPAGFHPRPPPRTGRVDTLILLTAREQAFFAGAWGARQTVVIPHGVDTDFFQPGAGPPAARSILVVGRFLRDLPITAATVRELAGRHPDWRFDFVVPGAVWHGPEFVDVRALPRARWHDRIDDAALLRLYQEATCQLIPFQDCTANNAIVESLACGLPIVTSDRGGVRDYGAGTLYPLAAAHTAAALAALCERYVAEPAWRAGVAAACRHFAVTQLAWPVIARRHLALYALVARQTAVLPAAPLAGFRRLKRLLDSNDFPWTFPLPPWAGRRQRAMRRLRQVARRVVRRRLVAERGWGPVLAQAAVWPVLSGVKAWLAVRDLAPGGPGPAVPARGWLDRWWVQLAHNLKLSDQEMLALDLPAARARLGLAVPCFEHQVLMDLINRNTGQPEVEEKRGFARFCARHQLPTIDVVAESDGRRVTHHQPLPPADLFLKPANMGCGERISTLPFDAARDRWRGINGESLDATEVTDYASRLQTSHPWVLQPRLRNASAWARFSPGALCTVRVVTGRTGPDGPVEIVGGFMRFPRGNAIVDNISCGALSADFDLATGRLGPARDAACPRRAISHHPDTGAAIAGEIIPAWDRVRALALRAHAPLTTFAMIGWDIALPGDEPALVEMNLNWGLFTNTPLGDTRYLEILSVWFDTPTPEVAAFLATALNA